MSGRTEMSGAAEMIKDRRSIMRISYAEKLHKVERRSLAAGKFFLGMAGLLCLLFVSVLASLSVFAEGKYTPVDAVIPFVCYAVEDAETEYRISIKAKENTSPVPDQDVIRLDEGGQGSFRICLTEPGTYDYLVYELRGEDDTIKYDDTKYDIHVFVTGDDTDKLEYTVAVNYADTDKKPEKVTFQNDVKSGRRDTEEVTEEVTEERTERSTEQESRTSQTGDDTALTLLFILGGIAVVGILVVVILKIRNAKRGEEREEEKNID